MKQTSIFFPSFPCKVFLFSMIIFHTTIATVQSQWFSIPKNPVPANSKFAQFEDSGNDIYRIGLGFETTNSNIFPSALLHIKAISEIQTPFQVDGMKVYMGSPDLVGSVEICSSKPVDGLSNRNYFGIYQISRSEDWYNYFKDKTSIGYDLVDAPSILQDHMFSVNGRIDLKEYLHFSRNSSDRYGIIIDNHDLDDVFTFTFTQSDSIPTPLLLDPWFGVIVHGLLQTDRFRLLENAGEMKVLMSDEEGNGTWTDISEIRDDRWLVTSKGKGFEPPNPSEMPSIYLNTQKYKSVLIGTDTSVAGYPLAVNGRILCEELKVKLYNEWPDYVFSKSYPLPSLPETDRYIRENGRLPGVPSAQEMKENGMNVGEMNALLLKKVEELTIHLIAMQKEMEELKAKLSDR